MIVSKTVERRIDSMARFTGRRGDTRRGRAGSGCAATYALKNRFMKRSGRRRGVWRDRYSHQQRECDQPDLDARHAIKTLRSNARRQYSRRLRLFAGVPSAPAQAANPHILNISPPLNMKRSGSRRTSLIRWRSTG